MSFEFEPLAIPDVVLVRSRRYGDARGWLTETYRSSAFRRAGITDAFLQDNHSLSAERGTLRGLHYQLPPHAQGKLVRCVSGAIYDVAVDLRGESPTFGRYVALELSSADSTMLWIPAGFAHGFQTLEPDTQVTYKATAEYEPTAERGIRWDDPTLAIPWPILEPSVSPRDAHLPPWDPAGTSARR